jgi:hypothetical protein
MKPNTQQTIRKGKEKDTSQKNDLQHIKTTFQHKNTKTSPQNAMKEKQHTTVHGGEGAKCQNMKRPKHIATLKINGLCLIVNCDYSVKTTSLHGVTSQKTALFIVTAMRTFDFTDYINLYQNKILWSVTE